MIEDVQCASRGVLARNVGFDPRGDPARERFNVSKSTIIGKAGALASIAQVSVAALALGASPSFAQSFDCARARTPVEKSICASPELIGLDAALAKAWSQTIDAIRSDPARAQAQLATQRDWIAGRDRSCGALSANAPRFAACLGDAYRARIAALGAVSNAPTARLPVEQPAPDATLSRATVSAVEDGDAIVDVKSAGRFSIRATSKTGVALQLVDMIAGPGDISGDAGTRDGRLDVLLDKGAYKLRAFGDRKANGDATLSVRPFRAVAAASSALLRGGEESSDLADLQQRSYWVIVGPSGRLEFEATGRSLNDLRAWRNGEDLSELAPASATIEPKPGHSMTRLRLEGSVEPGLYLVTAYGGASQPWADGDVSQPLYISAGAPLLMAGGLFDGVLGPKGSARFQVPPPASLMRLELPQPVAARLTASRGGASPTTIAIAKNSRGPVASLSVPTSGRAPAIVEVSGLEGQAFRFRALQPGTSLRIDAPGPHLVSVDVAGEGGDEVPATAVLARFQGGAGSVIASSAPRIAAGAAWRKRFNLRGSTTLIFEITTAGPVAANAQGVNVKTSLEPLVGARQARGDGKTLNRWDVEPGWYILKLEPVGNLGVVDLTFGQPGLAAPLEAAGQPRASIDLGLHALERGVYHQVFVNGAPGLVTGPSARALPANLGDASLSLQQPARVATIETPAPVITPPPAPTPIPPQPAKPKPGVAAKPIAKPVVVSKPLPPKPAPVVLPAGAATADGALVIPVRAPVGGTIVATDATGKTIDISLSSEVVDKDIRDVTVTVPPSEKARAIVLSFVKTEPPLPMPAIAARSERQALVAGTPVFFDLEKDARRSFLLTVPEGGLTRVETLGRLMTNVGVSTSFLPKLSDASDNGPGHNALLQTYLRAGTYRVDVGVSESSGHLGLVARPAALINAGVLVPEGGVRATLASGAGATIQIEVPRAGDYQLDLYGLGRAFTARLEDAGGWPLTQPGEVTTLQRRFEPGRYRLVVLPETVDARLVARLQNVEDTKPLGGHGPHVLPFGEAQSFQWREPAGKDATRDPDQWQFELQGPANVTLGLTDGMVGDLADVTTEKRTVAKIAYKRGFSGVLLAGRYLVEARAVGRNDRLDYEVDLRAREIQPGQTRKVNLPATFPFAIARDRVASFTTFGRVDLRGVLRDANGKAIGRLSGRADDWNIAMSRLLPAGAYRLDLADAKVAKADSSDGDDEASSSESNDDAKTDGAIEARFDLPAFSDARDLDLKSELSATGPNIHVFNPPNVDAGALMIVAARSSAELVLSLERRDADGAWRSLAFDRGRSPVIAAPADGDAAKPWRVSVWAIDGGAAEISIGARAINAKEQAPGNIAWTPLTIDGVSTSLRYAAINASNKTPLALKDHAMGLLQGSRAGRPLAPMESGLMAPQSDRVWLLARGETPQALHVDAVLPVQRDLALDLAASDTATLPATPSVEGVTRIWRATSTLGQPGISAGRGTGVTSGVAIAFAGSDPVKAWNAGSDEALRVRVESLEARNRPDATVDARYATVLAPGAAQVVRLPPGRKQIRIDVAPNVGVLASGGDGRASTIWAANATTRELNGAWTETTFVNLGKQPAPIALDLTPSNEEPALSAGVVTKRFFGAAGSVSLPVRAKAGDRLVIAGGSATFIGDDGRTLRGSPMSPASEGELVIEHGPDLVVAWIENDASTPWTMAPPTTVTMPHVARLDGVARGFLLQPATPVLLHARTTAPVILALGNGSPELFPAGAEFHRYLAAGDAELRVYSPHDGPLAGSLELTTTPVIDIHEGIGEAVALAPGASALFGFDVARAGNIGVGVRSTPDRAEARLLDAHGRPIGEGVAQLRRLEAGRYLLEARAPADGETLMARPAVVGVTPPDNGPPPDVAARYLELVGLTPTRAR
jgi:uncharacterized protein